MLDAVPGGKLEAAIIAAGGALSAVIGPTDPRRAAEMCDDFDKSALANLGGCRDHARDVLAGQYPGLPAL